jgi:hypothetical protein
LDSPGSGKRSNRWQTITHGGYFDLPDHDIYTVKLAEMEAMIDPHQGAAALLAGKCRIKWKSRRRGTVFRPGKQRAIKDGPILARRKVDGPVCAKKSH